jgi:hypothetical protein
MKKGNGKEDVVAYGAGAELAAGAGCDVFALTACWPLTAWDVGWLGPSPVVAFDAVPAELPRC